MGLTKQDTKTLLQILQTAYPNYYKDLTETQAIGTVELYYGLFMDEPREIVIAALKQYIKCNKYPPTPAGLQEHIDLLKNTLQGKNDDNLMYWKDFKRAIKSYNNSNIKEIFDNLPEPVRAFLVTADGLKEYGEMTAEKIDTVVKGHFDRAMTAAKKREKMCLPEATMKQLRGVLRISG